MTVSSVCGIDAERLQENRGEYLHMLPVINLEAFERDRQLLPPFPAVMTRIDAMLRSGSTNVAHLNEAIYSEVSLVARILRVVNSAYYNIPRRITDIKLAIAFLGFSEIHRIVLTSSIANAFKGANPQHLKHFWTHSYLTALIARKLLPRYERHLELGVLWPSALLHDIGELVYMRLFPKHFTALLRYRSEHQCLLDEAEEALGLPSHRVIGSELCDHWNLPETVKDGCLHHGRPNPSDPPCSNETAAIRRIVSLSTIMSNLTIDTLRPETQGNLQEQIVVMLGCGEEDLSRIMGEAHGLLDEVNQLAID